MERTIARIWPLAPAFAAVTGSVALSLLILQPPPAGLLPGTAPADSGRVGALVLPALVNQLGPAPVTAPVAGAPFVAPVHRTPRPTAATHHTPAAPAHKPAPAPAPAPAPTPAQAPGASTPPPAAPVSTPTPPPPAQGPVNNGRWKSASAHTWKRSAARQSERTHRGRPPWAGPAHGGTAAAAAPAPPPAAAPSPAHQTCHGRGCGAAPGAPATGHGHGKGGPPPTAEDQPTPAPAAAVTAVPAGPPSTPPGQDKGKKSPHS